MTCACYKRRVFTGTYFFSNLLGVQPGTVVRGNLIHDVRHRNYGARLIYLDGCSSHIVVENNICRHSSQEVLLHQTGRENIIRNNIFLFGRGYGQVGCFYTKTNEYDTAFTFIRNIVITDGLPVIHHYQKGLHPLRNIYSDHNLFWDISGSGDIRVADDTDVLTLAQWQKDYQCDLHSVTAAPRFADIKKFDVTLQEDSPAFALGFKSIDMSDVGPRVKQTPAQERSGRDRY